MKVMHGMTGTNAIRKEVGVTDNNKCSFCLTAKDNTYFGDVHSANISGHGFGSY